MLAKAQIAKTPQSKQAQLAAEVTDRHSDSGAQLRGDMAEAQPATAETQPATAETQPATAGAPSATAGTQPATAADPQVIVLDVRNDYEWDAGHFAGAGRPQEVGLV